MRQLLSVLLIMGLCLAAFSGCSSESTTDTNGTQSGSQTTTQVGTQTDMNVPFDLVEGLDYTLTACDPVTKAALPLLYLYGTQPDDGRLNDGKVFGETEYDNDSYLPFLIELEECKSREFQITFTTDGKNDACAVVFHNAEFGMTTSLSVDEIAVGDTADSLTAVDFEDDMTNKLGGGFADHVLSFEPVNFKVITVTFTGAGADYIAFSEISVLGFPTGQGATYLPDGWQPGDEIPDGTVPHQEDLDKSEPSDPGTFLPPIESTPSTPGTTSKPGGNTGSKPSSGNPAQNGDDPANRPADLPTGGLNNYENQVAGTWLGSDPESGDAVNLAFYSDRSGFMVQSGSNATFRILFFWKIENGTMTMYFNFLGYRAHVTPYTISGNTFTMQDEDGRSTTFTRQ